MHRREDALRYHREGRPGKIEVVPTKPVATQRDLSLAYTPGVAEPCREIHRDSETARFYTARQNLVGVITNGTAVLGLGDIGPFAAKPVMEGKAVLFKRYADIDVFDIEVDARDPERFVSVVAALEPTFGGINLEDIKGPDCFAIEQALRDRMSIPVFHDDQHGTAIIAAAALINAAAVQGKELASLRVTCIGAGAAAIGCMRLWVQMGVPREQITLIDRHGVVTPGRDQPFDPFKAEFASPASDRRRTLADAMRDTDVMIGLSSANIVDATMLRSMAARPIILALANPDPEVPYALAREVRPDAVVGTGRSDFPNQVNNVLGFPYIFRGALDVSARTINDEMKLAAAHALSALARQGVPDEVRSAYGGGSLKFGPDYIIPKPMDARALYWVAGAVADAAVKTGVARTPIDIDAYREELNRKVSPTRRVMWQITEFARSSPRRVVFPEGEELKILQAAQILIDDGVAQPILIGRPKVIEERAREHGVPLKGVEIIDRDRLPKLEDYAAEFFRLRQRKGVTRTDAERILTRSRTYYGMMMVRTGDAEGLVAGLTAAYPDTIRPALQVVGVREGVHRAAGLYVLITPKDALFLADTTIHIDPDAEALAEIAVLAADLVKDLGIEPRIAMLSFSNFGNAPHPSSRKVAEATQLVKERRPDLVIDGEMQADVALIAELREPYSFSALQGSANVLIFPNLDAGNIAYKLLAATGGGEVIGPLVLGMRRPVNVLQQGASVSTIVHMTAITVSGAIRRTGSGEWRLR